MALRVHNWTPLLDAEAGTQRCDKRGCGRVWYTTSIQPANDCPGIDTPGAEASETVGKVIPNIPPPNSGMSYMERMFGIPAEAIESVTNSGRLSAARIAEAVAFDRARGVRGYGTSGVDGLDPESNLREQMIRDEEMHDPSPLEFWEGFETPASRED